MASGRSKGVKGHLAGMGTWVVVIFTILAWMGGLGLAFGSGGRARVEGLVLAAVALPVIIATMDRWSRFVPIMLFLAALESGLVPFHGYSPHNPAPVPIIDRLGLSLGFLLAAFFSGTFAKKVPLTKVDRVCLVALVAFFGVVGALGAGSAGSASLVNSFAGACAGAGICLLICIFAWGYDKLRRRNAGPKRRATGTGEVHRGKRFRASGSACVGYGLLLILLLGLSARWFLAAGFVALGPFVVAGLLFDVAFLWFARLEVRLASEGVCYRTLFAGTKFLPFADLESVQWKNGAREKRAKSGTKALLSLAPKRESGLSPIEVFLPAFDHHDVAEMRKLLSAAVSHPPDGGWPKLRL